MNPTQKFDYRFDRYGKMQKRNCGSVASILVLIRYVWTSSLNSGICIPITHTFRSTRGWFYAFQRHVLFNHSLQRKNTNFYTTNLFLLCIRFCQNQLTNPHLIYSIGSVYRFVSPSQNAGRISSKFGVVVQDTPARMS